MARQEKPNLVSWLVVVSEITHGILCWLETLT